MLLLLIIHSITHSVVLGLHSHIHKSIQEYQLQVKLNCKNLNEIIFKSLLSTYIQQLAQVSNCMCLALAPQHLSTIADCHIVLQHNLTACLLAHINCSMQVAVATTRKIGNPSDCTTYFICPPCLEQHCHKHKHQSNMHQPSRHNHVWFTGHLLDHTPCLL